MSLVRSLECDPFLEAVRWFLPTDWPNYFSSTFCSRTILRPLFLAFPAIFPASATLIQKHQRDKKENAGLEGVKRGRIAAGIDAAGAAIGSLGLAAFATTAWKMLPRYPLWLTLTVATFVWAGLAITVLLARKRSRVIHKFDKPAR